MSQTNYAINTAAAREGLLGDMGAGTKQVDSYTDTVEAVPFGKAVCQSTLADDQCKLPASATEVGRLLGVALAEQSMESATSGVAAIPIGKPISVLRKGKVWVSPEEAVATTDPVYVRQAAGAFAQLGAFRKSADTVSSVDKATLVPATQARWLSATTAGAQLALLNVNLV